jgi:colicin import membrane protein
VSVFQTEREAAAKTAALKAAQEERERQDEERRKAAAERARAEAQAKADAERAAAEAVEAAAQHVRSCMDCGPQGSFIKFFVCLLAFQEREARKRRAEEIIAKHKPAEATASVAKGFAMEFSRVNRIETEEQYRQATLGHPDVVVSPW